MYYLNMLPYQVRDAIKRNLPAVLPLGVIEYHAEHLPLGVDTHVAVGLIEELETNHPKDMVVLPPFYYNTATYAVAGPEANGSINVDSKHLVPVAEDIFRALLRVGFRNIHAFIAHQTEEFHQGMPTDLAYRLAARNVIFEFLDKKHGEGWWGKEKNAKYYTGGNNPFSYIQVHPVRSREATKKRFKGDHTGVLETSEMLVLHPEQVEMDRIDKSLWYARTASEASKEFGEAALKSTKEDIAAVLFPGESHENS
jgi:creatinine amidohydrolase